MKREISNQLRYKTFRGIFDSLGMFLWNAMEFIYQSVINSPGMSRQRGNFRCLDGRWQIIWRMINIRRMMSIWQYLEGSVDIQWIADIQFSTQKLYSNDMVLYKRGLCFPH